MPEEPTNDFSQFAIGPIPEHRKGKRIVAANGSGIAEAGVRTVKFRSKEGEKVNWQFVVGKVRKTLKCIATICDEGDVQLGKEVVFRRNGGFIRDLKTKQEIHFDRIGNTYHMDAWLRKVPGSGEWGPDFSCMVMNKKKDKGMKKSTDAPTGFARRGGTQ